MQLSNRIYLRVVLCTRFRDMQTGHHEIEKVPGILSAPKGAGNCQFARLKTRI
jgi:hypothetical protein